MRQKSMAYAKINLRKRKKLAAQKRARKHHVSNHKNAPNHQRKTPQKHLLKSHSPVKNAPPAISTNQPKNIFIKFSPKVAGCPKTTTVISTDAAHSAIVSGVVEKSASLPPPSHSHVAFAFASG
jgi:hypothetical protein